MQFESLYIDLDKAKEGVWRRFCPDRIDPVSGEVIEEGIWVKIAQANNPAFNAMVRQLVVERKATDGIENLSIDQLGELGTVAAAYHIVKDWRNVTSPVDGSAVPYTPEQALVYLRDPRLPDFALFVQRESERRANFLATEKAGAEKNSSPASPGSSPTGTSESASKAGASVDAGS